MKGGQVYLDYISLSIMVGGLQQKDFKISQSTKMIGLPKGNGKREVVKRLIDALPKMEKKEFLQGVAISEISRVLCGFVMKNEDLVSSKVYPSILAPVPISAV